MDDDIKLTAMLAMQGMLAHSTRYRPRAQDEGKHWHAAIAAEAVDIAEAMEREFRSRISKD